MRLGLNGHEKKSKKIGNKVELMSQKYNGIKSSHRFIGIELLRWGSALGILFWHYQHFFFTKAVHGSSFQDYEDLPLYSILHPIYMNGAKGVQLFWAISGFVILHKYGFSSTKISIFVRNRLGRLYPLHLLTLILVGLLQLVSNKLLNESQIYFDNTFKNFLKHLFFASGWESNPSLSFNQPVWSVSLEILVYAIFTLVLLVKRFRRNPKYLWSTVLVGTFLLSNFREVHGLIMCILFFSLGATLRSFLEKLGSKAALSSTVLLFISLFDKYLLGNFLEEFGNNKELNSNVILLLQITSLIVIAINLDRIRIIEMKKEKIQVLGNLTYATYLLHVPFQVFVLVILKLIGLPVLYFAQNPLSLFGYLLFLNIIAYFTYRYIELPCNRYVKEFQFRR